MEIIFWSSVALFIIALIVVAILVIKERKIYADKVHHNRHVQPDDIPGRYMEILEFEQPFVEYY